GAGREERGCRERGPVSSSLYLPADGLGRSVRPEPRRFSEPFPGGWCLCVEKRFESLAMSSRYVPRQDEEADVDEDRGRDAGQTQGDPEARRRRRDVLDGRGALVRLGEQDVEAVDGVGMDAADRLLAHVAELRRLLGGIELGIPAPVTHREADE